MSTFETTLFAVTSLAGLAGFVDAVTSNILNEKVRDPFERAPLNLAIVCAILKYMYENLVRLWETSQIGGFNEKILKVSLLVFR